MKVLTRRAAALIALVALSACAVLEDDAGRAALRLAALSSVEALHAAGIDPVTLSPEARALAAANCGIASSLLTVYDVTVPDAAPEIVRFCADLVEAVGAPPAP